MDHEIVDAIAHSDAVVSARGPIWIGGEPTFTDATSESAEWHAAALGGDKQPRAERLVRALCAEHKEARPLILRSVGRQYPGEACPRWSYGLYRRRDGVDLWDGAPDPLLLDAPVGETTRAQLWAFRDAIAARLGRGVRAFELEPHAGAETLPIRLAYGNPSEFLGPQASRPPIDRVPIDDAGLRDPLAESGVYLVCIGLQAQVPRVDLPLLDAVPEFLRLLEVLGAAARQAALPALIIGGYPPPVDASVALTTITPDPAVVEVNMAPTEGLGRFHVCLQAIYAAAARVGLSPCRLRYNGEVADSGGGGHLTLGGPSFEQSPFVRVPALLPRLVLYFNRHPALSYLFAVDSLGSASQAPRPDEGTTQQLDELQLALHRLLREVEPAGGCQLDGMQPGGSPDAQGVYRSLAPFLVDAAGNTHRAEINVEKLCNPQLGARGRLGVLELRAFRMTPTPERAVAFAALLRHIVALLAGPAEPASLVRWGSELHDRFALPFFLRHDLGLVGDELALAGLALPAPLRRELDIDTARFELGQIELDGATLTVERALEFWPLVGDSASQERSTARWVDPSVVRVALTLRGPRRGDCQLSLVEAQGAIDIPLRDADDAQGPARVGSLRYRSFVPQPGLHPDVAARDPVRVQVRGPHGAVELELWSWIPGGGAYPGIPADADDAARRRGQRFVVRDLPGAPGPTAINDPPAEALSPYCFDLRYL